MATQIKIAPEQKIELVSLCMSNTISLRKAAQIAGVSVGTVCDWVNAFKVEGEKGLFPLEKLPVYTTEIKINAVLDYLNGNGSYRKIAQKHKLRSTTQLQRWVKQYLSHGNLNSSNRRSEGGSYQKNPKETTLDERVQIVKECLSSGSNYGEIALKYNASYDQVRRWTLKYEQITDEWLQTYNFDSATESSAELITKLNELERLKIEISKVENEIELLKKKTN